jgi:rubredoxin
MKYFYILIFVTACLSLSDAFRIRTSRRSLTQLTQDVANIPKTRLNMAETEYWQGEWVCADCGYVYDRDIDGGGLYFEQQQRGFICPQCSAPRKRYAKKVGDQWGVTRDGGDLPIYAFTFLGLAITTWFALVYVPSL